MVVVSFPPYPLKHWVNRFVHDERYSDLWGLIGYVRVDAWVPLGKVYNHLDFNNGRQFRAT